MAIRARDFAAVQPRYLLAAEDQMYLACVFAAVSQLECLLPDFRFNH